MGRSKPPPAPDYKGAAEAQGVANIEAARASARLNNPNIQTPWGSREIKWGDGDTATIIDRLSPEQQALFDEQTGLARRTNALAERGIDTARDILGSKFDGQSLPGIDFAGGIQGRDKATQALMDRQQPFVERDRAAVESQLANQGITRGSEAWTAAMDQQARKENDARLAAVSAGGAEQNRMYEMESNERNRAMQEAMAIRQMPLNELNALRSGAQITAPQFQQFRGSNIGAADVQNIAGQQGAWESDLYNARTATRNSNTQAAASAAAMAAAYFF